jgi:hypothetical protein
MKRARQPRWIPQPPPGLRPKLQKDQLIDLGLAHLANVDAIANGQATPEILWQTVGGTYTWLTAAELMSKRDPERFAQALHVMQAMVVACGDVADRYKRTGKVGFSGPEYTIAREAVEWMDALAEVVDRDTAIVAAEIGERHCNRVMQQMEVA